MYDPYLIKESHKFANTTNFENQIHDFYVESIIMMK